MASKSEIMNPNLLFSVNPDDVKELEKMARLYYDEHLNHEELEEKLDEMVMTIFVFQQLGLSVDVLKIKKIVSGMVKQRKDSEDIIENFSTKDLTFITPPNTSHLDFIASILNNVIISNFGRIEKLIGKKQYKTLFQGYMPHYFVEGKYLKYLS